MISFKNLSTRLTILRWRSENLRRRIFQGRLKRCWCLARSVLGAQRTPFLWMISQLGGVICRGLVGIIRWARELIWWEKELSRWSMWLMRTRRRMPSGRENGYQPKPNGSGRQGEGRREKHIHGEMNFAPAGNGWRTLGREGFQTPIVERTGGKG